MKVTVEMDGNTEAGEGFKPFPPGRYYLRVKKSTYKKASTGRHMFDLEMEVADGEYAGRKLWYNLVVIGKGEKGHGFFVQAMKALGLPYEGKVTFDESEFMGRTCQADVMIEKGTDLVGRNKITTAGFVTEGTLERESKKTESPRKTTPAREEEVPF